jgi:predicted nucleotidyltransferase
VSIEDISKKAILSLREAIPEIEAIYLFGSRAKGQATEHSDVDLAFLSKGSVGNLDRFKIQESLAILLNLDVDLIDLKEASEVMQFQVVSEGKRLFEKNELYVEEYEDKVYYLYLDLCELRQPIIDSIQESGSVYG